LLFTPLTLISGAIGLLSCLAARRPAARPTPPSRQLHGRSHACSHAPLPCRRLFLLATATPRRGDVIVFRHPGHPQPSPGKAAGVSYIKRVAGLPGDHVIYRDHTLIVNGAEVDQRKLEEVASHEAVRGHAAVIKEEAFDEAAYRIMIVPNSSGYGFEGVIPAGHYFVLGDNRDNSLDSRYWGFVPHENLLGRAFVVWLNWSWRNGLMWGRIGRIQ